MAAYVYLYKLDVCERDGKVPRTLIHARTPTHAHTHTQPHQSVLWYAMSNGMDRN